MQLVTELGFELQLFNFMELQNLILKQLNFIK